MGYLGTKSEDKIGQIKYWRDTYAGEGITVSY